MSQIPRAGGIASAICEAHSSPHCLFFNDNKCDVYRGSVTKTHIYQESFVLKRAKRAQETIRVVLRIDGRRSKSMDNFLNIVSRVVNYFALTRNGD